MLPLDEQRKLRRERETGMKIFNKSRGLLHTALPTSTKGEKA